MGLETILLTEEEKTNIFPYKKVLIISTILKDIFENYFKYRQYKRLKENRPIPKELISLGLDQKKHEESNKYSKEKLEYDIVSNLFSNFIDLLFIIFNLFSI